MNAEQRRILEQIKANDKHPERGEIKIGDDGCFYRGDCKNGLYEEWYPNGRLEYRDTYRDGKLNGVCEEWYENGQLCRRSNYKDGKLDGLFEWWDKNGQLIEQKTYKDGKIVL